MSSGKNSSHYILDLHTLVFIIYGTNHGIYIRTTFFTVFERISL